MLQRWCRKNCLQQRSKLKLPSTTLALTYILVDLGRMIELSRYASMYEVEVRHRGLSKYRMLRGSNRYEVEQRAAALSRQWDDEWARRQANENRRSQRLSAAYQKEAKRQDAAERTDAAEKQLLALSNILKDGLKKPSPFEWAFLKEGAPFSEPRPLPPNPKQNPIEPIRGQLKYNPRILFLDYIIPGRKQKLLDGALASFEADHRAWLAEVEELKSQLEKSEIEHKRQFADWLKRKAEFDLSKAQQDASVDDRANAALRGEEAAFSEYISLCLEYLTFPEFINFNAKADYSSSVGSCVIDAELPAPEQIPNLKEVRYVQARDEFVEKYISDTERSKFYDSALYQMSLRVIVGIFAADTNNNLKRITLNGWVDYVERASGMDQRSCILSVAVNRSDFDRIDFDRVDPKECFRSLKGVAASKLIGLAPVAPLERPRIVDSRFIESHEVASNVNVGVNLAAMDWQDFEHLVRQVFEHEFSSPGSEVHVTQASRDGGVDAIVFDPHPIKGGKIVIQAKRYTNTVDVGSVRDLYGTVHNEGAIKGILVTTSQFGPDARKFAQGKPITLIDGSNLLFMLEGMGVSARIDLKEAKALFAAATGELRH